MVDLNISTTVVVDLFLDSFAIISVSISLYVLKKISYIVNTIPTTISSVSTNTDILNYIQKTNVETLNAMKMSLEILQKHVEKIDHIVDNQSKLILKQEEVINRQEEVIGTLRELKENKNEKT